MAETPEQHPQPDPPPATSVAEEKKPSLPTNHSPAPWQLHPHVHEFDQFPTCFEIRGSDNSVIGFLVYNEADGITALEWADAALILAAPRLLEIFPLLRSAVCFMRGADGFDPASHTDVYIGELIAKSTALFEDLQKVGVL